MLFFLYYNICLVIIKPLIAINSFCKNSLDEALRFSFYFCFNGSQFHPSLHSLPKVMVIFYQCHNFCKGKQKNVVGPKGKL